MNVEIGTEAAQFPEKKYIYGIVLAVWDVESVLCLSQDQKESVRDPD
jgi:hypothetical protein